jgi:hypothetical protein
MRTHELKTWPSYFGALERGEKTFEFRKDDRSFEVGDVLRLLEYDEMGYTGREVLRRVTYVARGGVIPIGFCAMSVLPISAAELNAR